MLQKLSKIFILFSVLLCMSKHDASKTILHKIPCCQLILSVYWSTRWCKIFFQTTFEGTQKVDFVHLGVAFSVSTTLSYLSKWLLQGDLLFQTPTREDKIDKRNNVVISYFAGLSEKLSFLQSWHPSVLKTQSHTQTKTCSSQRQNS